MGPSGLPLAGEGGVQVIRKECRLFNQESRGDGAKLSFPGGSGERGYSRKKLPEMVQWGFHDEQGEEREKGQEGQVENLNTSCMLVSASDDTDEGDIMAIDDSKAQHTVQQ